MSHQPLNQLMVIYLVISILIGFLSVLFKCYRYQNLKRSVKNLSATKNGVDGNIEPALHYKEKLSSNKHYSSKDEQNKDWIMKIEEVCKDERPKIVRSHSEHIEIPITNDMLFLDVTDLRRKNKADIIILPEPLVASYQATTPVASVWSTNMQSLYKKSTMTRITNPRGFKI